MPDHRWLILRLEAPLLAFGGVTIDQMGVTRDFPAASMLTGLLANAMGWHRSDWEKHQALQDRLVFASRWDRKEGRGVLTDTQNARLAASDKGWTTWGEPEGRDGSSYGAPHRRFRDYHPDACVIIALRLTSEDAEPTLGDLAAALDRPARPIFIGRKSCLPSAPLRQRFDIVAPTAYDALRKVPVVSGPPDGRMLALWPFGEGPEDLPEALRVVDIPDLRNWRTGLHGGTRKIVEGFIVPAAQETAE